MNCPRCSKDTHGGYAHTCTPTEGWRKMEAEIAELKRKLEYQRNAYQERFSECDKYRKQLAESQAREARLRAALTELSCLGNGNVPGNSIGNGIAQLALSIPHDDTALKEYHDSIVEKCAKLAGDRTDASFLGSVSAAILNLKGSV